MLMKAIRVEKQGGPEVLKLVEIAPVDAPGAGQAVVRAAAAGVNFLDVGQRLGIYPCEMPFTLSSSRIAPPVRTSCLLITSSRHAPELSLPLGAPKIHSARFRFVTHCRYN
jgi:hypothetical protein